MSIFWVVLLQYKDLWDVTDPRLTISIGHEVNQSIQTGVSDLFDTAGTSTNRLDRRCGKLIIRAGNICLRTQEQEIFWHSLLTIRHIHFLTSGALIHKVTSYIVF